MADIDEAAVKGALAAIPEAHRVAGVVVKDRHVHIMLDIEGLASEQAQALRTQCEALASALDGVLSATCVLTAHKTQAKKSGTKGDNTPAPNREIPAVFENIRHVIAVASGKGGVGKSTIAVNLALALHHAGQKVGLLDADIYGPSAPQLLGITTRPDVNEDKKLVPITAHGLDTMSIGYMVPPEQAMIWRGPMVQSALVQMLNDVAWQPLDVLVLDMPPGTGDIQLTMAQRIPVSGAVIVSTPAQLALVDVRRAIAMLRRVDIPIFGLVNNMAYMDAPDGTRLHPFGDMAGAQIASDNDIDWGYDLPLTPALQEASDSGVPFLKNLKENDPTHQTFTTIAQKLLARL